MKKGLFLVLAVSLFAGQVVTGYSNGFGGSFAGGLTGSMVGSAITSKRGSSRGEVEAARAQERVAGMQREQALRNQLQRDNGYSPMMFLMFVFMLLLLIGVVGLGIFLFRKRL